MNLMLNVLVVSFFPVPTQDDIAAILAEADSDNDFGDTAAAPGGAADELDDELLAAALRSATPTSRDTASAPAKSTSRCDATYFHFTCFYHFVTHSVSGHSIVLRALISFHTLMSVGSFPYCLYGRGCCERLVCEREKSHATERE